MSFSLKETSLLTGATIHQLRSWARKGLLEPEVNRSRPMRYSFRDVVALRTVAKLRAFTSLQQISKAIRTLEEQKLLEHLSQYSFAWDGKSIKVKLDEHLMDIDRQPGQLEWYTFAEIYEPFENFRGRYVPNLLAPAEGISVNPAILGGQPTIAGSRVAYSIAADYAQSFQSQEELDEYFPFLTLADVRNAQEFERSVEAIA